MGAHRIPAQAIDVPPGPLLITVEEAARRLAIGRTVAFELIAAGRLRSVKVGRLRRVPVEAVVEFVESLAMPGRGGQ